MLAEIEQFVNWVHRRNSEARTWRDYQYDLKQFADAVNDIPPAEVTFRDIDRFIQIQAEKGYKHATINRRLAAILAFYTFLSEEDETIVCPVLPHRHNLREPQRLPRPVQKETLQPFFLAISDSSKEGIRDKAMFLLMLRCGLRIAEVAALRISDLFLDESRPRMIARGKGSRERSVYLSPQAEYALRAYLASRPVVTSDFVFLSYQLRGMSTTAIHKRLVRYRTKANVYLTAHRLRHSFASDLIEADVPVTTIQKLMGHRWLETTQIYIAANDHKVQEDYYAACLKLEGWI